MLMYTSVAFCPIDHSHMDHNFRVQQKDAAFFEAGVNEFVYQSTLVIRQSVDLTTILEQ